jgi:hypothetical protein
MVHSVGILDQVRSRPWWISQVPNASLSVRAVLSDPAEVSGILAHNGCLLVAFHVFDRVGPRMSYEAQSLPLQYGPDVALSTLSSCRYLHEPKTRFPVGGWPLPGRESHPLDAPDLSWRTKERLNVDLDNPLVSTVQARHHIANGLMH